MKVLVADASPLIVIAQSGLIPMFVKLVKEVIVPQTVYAECTSDISRPGAQAIRDAAQHGQIHVLPDASPPAGDPGEASLDAGELAAIYMATELRCTILVDDRLGRQAATRRGLAVIGSAGLLLEAKKQGVVPAVAPILDMWKKSGYFLADSLIEVVLERAGE